MGSVPTWVAAYFAAYAVFVLWAHADDLRAGKSSRWVGLSEFSGDVARVWVAVSYWSPALRDGSADWLAPLYVFSCVSFVLHGALSALKIRRDPDLAGKAKRFVFVPGVALALTVTAPLLYWGWQSGFCDVYAE